MIHPDWLIRSNFRLRVSDNLHTDSHQNLWISTSKKERQSTIFGTAEKLNRLQGRQLNLMVNRLPINSTTIVNYKYLGVHLDPTLNFETHFHKTYKNKAAGRVTLLPKIRSSITCVAAQVFTGPLSCLFLLTVI